MVRSRRSRRSTSASTSSGLAPSTRHARRIGEQPQQDFVALDLPIVRADEIRQCTAPQNPRGSSPPACPGNARTAFQDGVPDDLGLGAQGPPTASQFAFGQVHEQVFAQHLVGRRERRQSRLAGRRGTSPGPRRIQRGRRVAEQGPQCGQQLGAIFGGQAPRPRHATAFRAPPMSGRIWAGSTRRHGHLRSIARIALAGKRADRPIVRDQLEVATRLLSFPLPAGFTIGLRQRPRQRTQQGPARETRTRRAAAASPMPSVVSALTAYATLTISCSRWPAGTSMTTESPSCLPIRRGRTGRRWRSRQLDIGFVVADDLVALLFVGFLVDQGHGGAEYYLRAGES